MSQASTAVSAAAGIDWSVVATASAVFLGTLITTIYGWIKGKANLEKKITASPTGEGSTPMHSAIIQDSMAVREATLVNREVRDQLVLINHGLSRVCKSNEELTSVMEDILHEVKRHRDHS